MAGRNSVTGMGSSTYTHYFVTFELEKGKRLELGVKDAEFGMLAEGDQGVLTPVYIAPEDRGLVY